MTKVEISVNRLIDLATDEMLKLDYKPSTIKTYLNIWKSFLKYAEEQNAKEFSERLGADFLKFFHGWPSERENTSYKRRAARSIRVLGDFRLHGLILRGKRITRRNWEDCYAEEMLRFKSFAGERLSPASVFRVEQVIMKFFEYLLAQGVTNCSGVLIPHITGFAETLSGYAKKTLSLSMYSLRIFLDFLHKENVLDTDLRKHVPTITHVKRRNIPSTWSKDETDKIISAVDRGNPCGKRDYAILLTIARLGLRQSDIVNLRFDNIDWHKCAISINQTKTKRLLVLPLPEDVGDAIINYLQFGRPPSDEPFVFLKHIPPFEQMKNVYALMDKHVRIAAITRKQGGQKGPHSLRHSLAGRMLEKNVPIETISAVLGHASVESTSEYLKIDVHSLSECMIDPEEALVHV